MGESSPSAPTNGVTTNSVTESSGTTSSEARNLNRRQLFRAGAGLSASIAVGAALAACGSAGTGAATSSTGGAAAGSGAAGGASTAGGAGATTKKTVTLWEFYSGAKPLLPNGQWWRDIATSWNKENGDIQLDDHYVTNADYSSGTALATAFASGSGPDVFLVSSGSFLKYYNGGVLADLSDHLTKDQIADYAPGILDTRMVGGKIYGLPMEVAPIAFYYSIKAFEDAHLSEADVPKTWEDLLDVGQKLTTKDRFGLLFDTTPGAYQNFTWYPFMWMAGGEVASSDGKSSAFGSPEVTSALALWQDAINHKVAPRSVQGTNGSDLASNLLSGYCAIQQCGAWALNQGTDEQKKATPYGMFKLSPQKAGGQSITDLGGWCLSVNAKSKNLDEAIKFASWAVADMSPAGIERAESWAAAASDISTRLSARKLATQKGSLTKGLQFFQDEAAPGGRAEPRFPPEVVKAISDAIQNAQLNGMDPTKAAAQSSQQIDSFLSGYTGGAIS